MTAREPKDKPLAPSELRTLRAALSQARGRKRLDVILGARDPQSLVRALPADELYLTIRDVGPADSAVLVQLASPEQVRVFLDLEAWHGDSFDPRKALPWLRAARAGSQRDPKAAARWSRKLRELDREVLFLVLRDALRVHDLEVDPDPHIESDRFMRTSEGKYVVEFLVDGVEYAAVRGLVDDLIAEDPFQATRLLSSLRWETPSDLEETALRWRAGRLADLGWPSLEEALSWFARPPKAPPRPPGPPPARPAGFFLATLARGTLLDRAAARLPSGAAHAVEPQIVAAANAVLVADAVDPGDVEAVRGAFEAARAYLELGLEKLAGADEERAAEALATTPVKRIFQEGFGRVLELSWRAQRIRERLGPDERLGSPLDEALAALASKRPRYFPGIEAPRAEWGTVAAAAYEPRHFRSAEDLAQTEDALRDAEARIGARGG
ncbi:MAG TPA: DUF6178 family protein [Anaeromyxobacter sp.]|nr:DUF6178 family protein [Anaeromyxobacter sp.]